MEYIYILRVVYRASTKLTTWLSFIPANVFQIKLMCMCERPRWTPNCALNKMTNKWTKVHTLIYEWPSILIHSTCTWPEDTFNLSLNRFKEWESIEFDSRANFVPFVKGENEKEFTCDISCTWLPLCTIRIIDIQPLKRHSAHTHTHSVCNWSNVSCSFGDRKPPPANTTIVVIEMVV